jgi:hypothetical protein
LELLDNDRGKRENALDFRKYLESIITEIELIDWLPREDSDQLANVFIVNFTNRFNSISKFMHSSLSAQENRAFSIKILDQIRGIKNEVIDSLHKKYQCNKVLSRYEKSRVVL